MTPALALLYGLLAFAAMSSAWPISSPDAMDYSIRSRQATRSSVVRQLDPSRTRRKRDTPSAIVYPTCSNSPLPAGTGDPWSSYSGQTIGTNYVDWTDTTESSCRAACTNTLDCFGYTFNTDSNNCYFATDSLSLYGGSGWPSYLKGKCDDNAEAVGVQTCCTMWFSA